MIKIILTILWAMGMASAIAFFVWIGVLLHKKKKDE